jgi:hypothetical protein
MFFEIVSCLGCGVVFSFAAAFFSAGFFISSFFFCSCSFCVEAETFVSVCSLTFFEDFFTPVFFGVVVFLTEVDVFCLEDLAAVEDEVFFLDEVFSSFFVSPVAVAFNFF